MTTELSCSVRRLVDPTVTTKFGYYFNIASVLVLLTGCSGSNKVEEFLKQGDEAQQNEQYDEAIKYYSGAIRINSKSAMAHLDRGSVYVITGKFDQALEDLNTAIRLDPENPLCLEMRGHA